jgi:hypothetical protein
MMFFFVGPNIPSFAILSFTQRIQLTKLVHILLIGFKIILF